MRPLLLSFFFVLATIINLNAQCGDPDVFCMNTGLQYTCTGTFMDAGGDDVYPAQSAVMTFCSDQEGFKTAIHFTTFDLFGGVDILNSDQLIIFDGTSENDPLIGIYSGSDLVDVTVSASNGNPSGCLMIQFISGGLENTLYSGWEAEVSCEAACAPPSSIASVLDTPQENGIYLNCLYDEITLSGTGSTAAVGHTIVEYVWDLKDGTLETSATEDIVHQYELPAIYDVVLQVIDDIGCAGETTIHVGMVGAPIVNATEADSICLGAEINLEAIYTPAWINNAPHLVNNIALFIPDDQTQSFQTEINVTGYQGGATINSCDDIQGIDVSMEHSYLGDLVIELICPNGQSVLLHDQGGSGTFLGEPVDDETTTPGIGYDYTWSDNDTNESMQEASLDNFYSTLPAGTYAPIEPLCNLIGCPLNGIWALRISDLFGADNGNVFSWGLVLAAGNNAEALEYHTTILEDAASSFWSGDGVVSTNDNADIALVNTSTAGNIDMIYTTVDNLGCTYEAGFPLEVIENPIDIELPDFYDYEAGYINIPVYNNTYTFSTLNCVWTPADGLSNPFQMYTQVLLPNDNTSYTLTATADNLLGCSDTETIGMTLPELYISGHIFFDANQNGIYDAEEQTLANFPFIANNTGMLSFSDVNGFYSAYCTYGSNTITLDVDPDLWIVTTPISFTTTLGDGQLESLNNNFGIYPSSNPQIILNGAISNSNTWCMMNDVQTITVSNDGNTIQSGYIVYTYDPNCNLVSTEPAPTSIDGNNITFSFQDLMFSDVASFQVVLDLSGNSAGDELNFTTQTFYYDGEIAVAVETDPLNSVVVCSYDPNDKREMNGTGEFGMIAPNNILDYVIRFQNTGNAPAVDVVITDQLPAQLDFNTFDPVTSSHPFTVTVNSTGLATFNFDDIYLPDSTSDFEGSIGFVHFRIQQDPDLAIGTVIENEANIYFDLNAPVLTNTAINTIMDCSGAPLNITVTGNIITIDDMVSDVNWYIDDQLLPNAGYLLEVTETGNYYATASLEDGCPAVSSTVLITAIEESQNDQIDLYPNPATQVINLKLPEGRSTITIYDQLGQTSKSLFNASGNVQIPVGDLPRGSYTVSVVSNASISHHIVVLQ